MIDLHCHILPGVDDGPATMTESIAMAEIAAANGITTIVATPHLREDHPLELESLPERVDDLDRVLADVPITVVGGAEVALTKAVECDDAALRRACLGGGSYLLVESPYQVAGDLLESALFELQVRGFRPLLAHPERSPSFLRDRSRLARIVERGVPCSITAASMTGRFGRTVRAFTVELLHDGLVHNVASDAHDTVRRPPDLRSGFDALDRTLPGLGDQRDWLTLQAPTAILAGEDLPSPPSSPARRRRRRGRGLLARWRS